MGEWLTIPPFVDDTITHVDVWQDIRENLYSLKFPMYAQTLFNTSSGTWTTTITTFADVDNAVFRIIFESFGNDILVGIPIEHYSSGDNGSGYYTLELDGVQLGNTDGLMAINIYGAAASVASDVHQLLYIMKNVASGVHTLDLQFKRGAVGATTTAYTEQNEQFAFWVKEL